jgi:prefoldin alpha subunit
MEQQEYLIKLQMLEQQTAQFGEQLQLIDKQVVELDRLKENVARLEESEKSEMFSEVGKGIYVKGKLESPEMMVDVGNKVLVPKTGKEILGIVDSQIKKFADVKVEISKKVEEINQEVDSLIKGKGEALDEDSGKKGSKEKVKGKK